MLVIAIKQSIADTSSGTGFYIGNSVIVTNQHVVNQCSNIQVFTKKGRYPARILAEDALLDLGLIEAPGLSMTRAPFRKSNKVNLGEPVYVYGYPLSGALSSEGNFTVGNVSALKGLRELATNFQITAPIQKGNSGGPVVDASGNVIGVVVSKLDVLRAAMITGDFPQNINFAISLEAIKSFLRKNNAVYRIGADGEALNSKVIAKKTKQVTVSVLCEDKSTEVIVEERKSDTKELKTIRSTFSFYGIVFKQSTYDSEWYEVQDLSNIDEGYGTTLEVYDVIKACYTRRYKGSKKGSTPSSISKCFKEDKNFKSQMFWLVGEDVPSSVYIRSK